MFKKIRIEQVLTQKVIEAVSTKSAVSIFPASKKDSKQHFHVERKRLRALTEPELYPTLQNNKCVGYVSKAVSYTSETCSSNFEVETAEKMAVK